MGVGDAGSVPSVTGKRERRRNEGFNRDTGEDPQSLDFKFRVERVTGNVTLELVQGFEETRD